VRSGLWGEFPADFLAVRFHFSESGAFAGFPVHWWVCCNTFAGSEQLAGDERLRRLGRARGKLMRWLREFPAHLLETDTLSAGHSDQFAGASSAFAGSMLPKFLKTNSLRMREKENDLNVLKIETIKQSMILFVFHGGLGI